jgi:hypothetical protein
VNDDKRLYIFVEGPDDERFFEHVVVPLLKQRYAYVKIVQWAGIRPIERLRRIRNLGQSADWLFVTDNNLSPCVTVRKQKLQEQMPTIDVARIFVVVESIEGWYWAGVDETSRKKLKIRKLGSTEQLTKDYFRQLRPRRYQSNIDFMAELLKHYSIETAKASNRSFAYFCRKILFDT